MVRPCNCSLLRLLAVMCIVLHGIGKTSVSGSNSCEVTKSTIQIVDDCPDSEEKWRKAAARKNCSAYASQCSEPDKFVYHCVINEYVTQTLEVCAYTRYIFSGKCTGYSIGGNVIQQNSRTDCAGFKTNSCPSYYNSDEAYKYPDCYQLTKKTTATENPTFMTDRATSAVVFTRFNVSSNTSVNMLGKEENTENNNSTQTIIIVLCVVLVLIVVVAISFLFKRIRRKSQNKNKQKEEESHHLNGTGKNVQI